MPELEEENLSRTPEEMHSQNGELINHHPQKRDDGGNALQKSRVCGAAKAGAFHSAHAEMQLLSMLLATNHVVELSRLSRLKHYGMIRAGIIAYGAQPGWTVPLSHGRSG